MRWIWVSLLCCACAMPTAVGARAVDDPKDVMLRQTVEEFQRLFYNDPNKRGKTFDVIIKDFGVDDEETYAIVDQISRFYMISLWAYESKDQGVERVCVCSESSIGRVREDLIAQTRSKGIPRQFTVPVREQDLPVSR